MRCVQCHLANGFFPAGKIVKQHQHTEFQIEIVIEGVFDFQIGGEVISLHPGDALAVASQTERAWQTKKRGDHVRNSFGRLEDRRSESETGISRRRRTLFPASSLSDLMP